MGVLVPEEFGGSGFGYHEYITVITEDSEEFVVPLVCQLQHTTPYVQGIY